MGSRLRQRPAIGHGPPDGQRIALAQRGQQGDGRAQPDLLPRRGARHQGGDADPDPESWRQRATEVQGSWWEPWRDWSAEHGGEMRTPPPMGSETYPPIEDAPGSYVLG